MQFLEAEVNELTRTVWETVLDLPIEGASADVSLGEAATISACVQIAGEWNGSVIMSCPVSLGTTIAARMFDLEPAEVDEELLHDAVGEVVNMIGGNVKGLVPGPSQLSLPAVASGIDTQLGVPGSQVVTRVGFLSASDAVRVVLMTVDGGPSATDAAQDGVQSTPSDPATVS